MPAGDRIARELYVWTGLVILALLLNACQAVPAEIPPPATGLATITPGSFAPSPAPAQTQDQRASTEPAAPILTPTESMRLAPTSLAPTVATFADTPTQSALDGIPAHQQATEIPSLLPTPWPTPTNPPPRLAALENSPPPQPGNIITQASAGTVTGLALWGKGNNNDGAYSSDGSLLAVASSIGVFLYNTNPLREVHWIETSDPVESVAFSPDHRLLAAGMRSGAVNIYRAGDWALIKILIVDDIPARELAFSPIGQVLFAAHFTGFHTDAILRFWQVSDWKLASQEKFAGLQALDISADGSLAATTNGRSIYLWNIEERRNGKAFDASEDVALLNLSSDGKRLFTVGAETTSFWQTVIETEMWKLHFLVRPPPLFLKAPTCNISVQGSRESVVRSIAFAPDGNTFAVGLVDDSVQMRRTEDGALIYTFPQKARKLLYSPDGRILTVFPYDGTIQFHRAVDGNLEQLLVGHTQGFTSLSVSPDGELLAAGASDGRVRQWKIQTGQRRADLETQADSVAFSPDGKTLATGSGSGEIRLWDLINGGWINSQTPHLDRVASLHFTRDSRNLISSSRDCTIRLWMANNGTPMLTLPAGEDRSSIFVEEADPSPDGQYLAVAGDPLPAIYLYHLMDGILYQKLETQGSTPTGVAFSPNSKYLAASTHDKVILWRTDTFEMVLTLDQAATRVAFGIDGQLLASGSPDGTIQLWNFSDGRLLNTLHGHNGMITGLVFTPDGRYLASSSDDGTVRLWGVGP